MGVDSVEAADTGESLLNVQEVKVPTLSHKTREGWGNLFHGAPFFIQFKIYFTTGESASAGLDSSA